MGLVMNAAALLGLVSAVLAVPAPQAGAQTAAADSNACGVVSESYARQKALNQTEIRVPASQAFACLQTVPNKPEPAMKLVQSYKAYASWESTLAYLKDPPASYGLPAVDIMGGLDMIMQNVMQNKFQSEYEFQANMTQLVGRAHDGHFAYRPDVFKAFGFRNDLVADMVSLSVDGKQVPKLYNLGLVNGSKTMVGNVTMPMGANGMPPAITKINGQDATEFLVQDGLNLINTQDQDSQWNAQFQNYASQAGQPVVSASIFHRGDSVTLEYDNGQKITQDSYAIIRKTADFGGIKTGEDFYQRFCNPQLASTNATSTQPQTTSPSGAPAPPPANLLGFPKPAFRDSGANVTSGYFLTGQGYDDVAVLSVLGFAPESTTFDSVEYLTNLQTMTADFLATSKAQGKKKLVIDVSGNGGGIVVAGFDMYSQIFPNNTLFQANNLRRSESLVQMANIGNDNLDKILNLKPSDLTSNATRETFALAALAQSEVVSNLLPGGVFSAGGRINYTSTAEIISPVNIHGDDFTAYQVTPLNQTSSDFNLTGTGNKANPPAAVFAPENVVLLTDGNCGSTCTLFSYLLIMQQNVKAVSVGGRPQTGPMQSIGGVEGAQVFELESLQSAAAAAITLAPADMRKQLLANSSELALIAEGYALDRAASPGAAGAVNGKNAFSHTDAQTPLQFTYQPANCKFFYTKDMVYGPEATWKRAVDAAFNDPNQFCVDGSQTPLMGVQEPSADFFTPTAEGIQNATVASPKTAGAGRGVSGVDGLAVLCVALVSVALVV